jgi:hypothetical protein
MAYPTTISIDDFTVYGNAGPFLIGSARYACLKDSFGNLAVFRSDDAGVTWTEKDAAGAPLSDNYTPNATCTDGTKLYIVFSNGPNMVVSIFDTTSDTWGAMTVCSATVDALNSISICYRPSDANVIVGSQIPVAPSTQAAYFTFNTVSLAFTDWTLIGNAPNAVSQWFCYGVFRGLNRTVFYLAMDNAGAGTIRSVYQQCLTDGGALGVISLVDTTNDANASFFYAGNGSSASTIAIAWSKNSNSLDTIVLQAPIIDNDILVWSSRTVTADPSSLIWSVALAVGPAGTYCFIATFLPGGGPPSSIQYSLDAGAGFSPLVTLTSIIDLADINLWAGSLGIGSVGIIMSGSGIISTYYWELGATPAPPAVAIPPQVSFFSFPLSIDCCCPEDVACLKRSKNGKLYAFSKGPLALG